MTARCQHSDAHYTTCQSLLQAMLSEPSSLTCGRRGGRERARSTARNGAGDVNATGQTGGVFLPAPVEPVVNQHFGDVRISS